MNPAPLRFGLIVQTELLASDRDTPSRVRELRQQVRTARSVGFDGIGLGHHHSIGRTQRLHPVVLGAALAEEAVGMDLATLVYLIGQYHPLEVSEQIASLDAIWDGRLKLGVAPGWVREEFDALGLDYAARLPRFLEGLETLRQLWSGQEIEHDGRFFSLAGVRSCHLPVQRPTPDIWLGATVPKAARRVADLGHAYLMSGHPTIADIEPSLAAYRSRLNELGKEDHSDRPILRNCFVADTDEEALEIAAPHLRESYKGFAEWQLFDRVLGEAETGTRIRDEAKAGLGPFQGDRVLLGSPENLRRQVKGLVDRLGVNYLFLRLQWPGLSNDRVLEAIERVGAEVVGPLRTTAPSTPGADQQG